MINYQAYLKSLQEELTYLTDEKRIEEVKQEIERVERQLTVLNWFKEGIKA